MVQGLSVREFAERDGCSPTLVQRAKKSGRLTSLADGSLDPSGVGTEWRESKRRAQDATVHKAPRAQAAQKPVHDRKASADGPAAEHAEAALAALTAPDGVFASRGEAEKVRDSYIAHLRRIEYEQKRGALIEVDKVTTAMEDDYGRVRTRLMALPAERAPQLHRCKTVVELQDALMAMMVEVLEELSHGS